MDKNAMDRMGLFSEPGYHTINDPYISSSSIQHFMRSANKGKQMLAEGNKSKSALDDGYFQKPFQRLFQGEGYLDEFTQRRLTDKARRDPTKMVGKDWFPASGNERINGIGSYFGTFAGIIESFRPNLIDRQPQPRKKGFISNPGKRGTGYGYMDVCIGPYPEHMHEQWTHFRDIRLKEENYHKDKIGNRRAFLSATSPPAFFDPNPYASDVKLSESRMKKSDLDARVKPFIPSSYPKKSGGCKAGTFTPTPEYSSSPYTPMVNRFPVNVVNASGRLYYPPKGPKSMVTRSVMQQNVKKRMNNLNYKTFKSAY